MPKPVSIEYSADLLEFIASTQRIDISGLTPSQRQEVFTQANSVLSHYSDLLETVRQACLAPQLTKFARLSKAREKIEAELASVGCVRIEYTSSDDQLPNPNQQDNFMVLRKDDKGDLFLLASKRLEVATQESLLELLHELMSLFLVREYTLMHPNEANESLEILKKRALYVGPMAVVHVADVATSRYLEQK